ncbi:MAG: MaoC family dehydratase N-terminal domain-containing protein [Micrococcales bacterium]|nr:MaoC family dehydratase N-terminal domain-containing protein [Micrococcales bacterium]
MTAPGGGIGPRLGQVRPQVGDNLGPLLVQVSRADLVRYAGASGDFNPIHFSDAAAEAAGLPSVIAHGMFTMGAAIDLVVDWLGDPGRICAYNVRFARPVPVPPTGSVSLEVSGRIRAVNEDTAELVISVQLGGTRLLGKASATVRLAPAA